MIFNAYFFDTWNLNQDLCCAGQGLTKARLTEDGILNTLFCAY